MFRGVRSTLAFFSLLVVLAFAFVAVTVTHADEWNKTTKITLPDATEVPGMVLPAGTYTFKLAETSNRNVVQIWNADETKLLTTFIAVPDYREKPAGRTIVKFNEAPMGSPEAIREWFYPGDLYGQEFVYPKGQATKLAAATHQNVLGTQEYKQPPNNEAQNLRQQQVMQETQNGEQPLENTQNAANNTASHNAANPAVAQNRPPSHLPQTASPLGFILLAGVIWLLLGAAARVTAKRPRMG